MIIGIDISQVVYGAGVGNFVERLVDAMIAADTKNTYILFASSLRRKEKFLTLQNKYKDKKNVTVKIFSFPPAFLDMLWNKLHVFPIEWFIGRVDVFISSDWTQPPVSHAKKITIIYDMIVYKHPKETAESIIEVQKRRLSRVKKEIDLAICISEATKKDTMEILGLPESKLSVVYPGL